MLLFTPGPTPIPESIRLAMGEPTLHHRTAEFEAIFKSVRESLLDMLGSKEVLLLASSGSGAMETCVRTFTKSKMLSINSGKFGERYGKIAKAYNIPYTEIINDWNTAPSKEEVLKYIKEDSTIDCVCFQICESAGGLRHHAEEIAQAIKEHNPNICVVADAITAMGVEPIDISHIDALIGGSQKAFMLPPGMSIIALSQMALDIVDKRDVGFYFNLKTELKNQVKNTTAWTAPTTIIIGLKKYFEIASSIGGVEQVYKDTKARSLATNKALEKLGLSIYPHHPALAMTTIYSEKYAKDIRSILKNDFGVNVAGGQDKLKESIFRINHMGIIPVYESAWVVNAVELALDKLGIRKYDGLGSKVFTQEYFKI